MKPIETKTCKCCGGTIGTYRFTVTAEFWQEVDIEAPNEQAALLKMQDELTNMHIGGLPNWFGVDLKAYNDDGDQVLGG